MFLVEKDSLDESNLSSVTNIQNWSPEGLNTGVGDVMPFSHDGTFHLFYLFDRRGHESKWGLGAHQWAACFDDRFADMAAGADGNCD